MENENGMHMIFNGVANCGTCTESGGHTHTRTQAHAHECSRIEENELLSIVTYRCKEKIGDVQSSC